MSYCSGRASPALSRALAGPVNRFTVLYPLSVSRYGHATVLILTRCCRIFRSGFISGHKVQALGIEYFLHLKFSFPRMESSSSCSGNLIRRWIQVLFFGSFGLTNYCRFYRMEPSSFKTPSYVLLFCLRSQVLYFYYLFSSFQFEACHRTANFLRVPSSHVWASLRTAPTCCTSASTLDVSSNRQLLLLSHRATNSSIVADVLRS